MAKKHQEDDGGKFVILCRDSKSSDWNLSFIVDARRGSSLEMAWREAHSIDHQMHTIEGNRRHESIVVSLKNYDDKVISPVKPPRGFVLELQKAAAEADIPVVRETPIVQELPVPVEAKSQEVAPPAERKVNPLFEMVVKSEPTPTTPRVEKQAGKFALKLCPYCGNEVPSNGAAQFSHLKKHINELVGNGRLTKEQGDAIRSIRLQPEIQLIFEESFKAATNA